MCGERDWVRGRGPIKGIESISMEDTDLQVSDAERTVLDALDYPRTFGDMRVALDLVKPALERVEHKRLMSPLIVTTRLIRSASSPKQAVQTGKSAGPAGSRAIITLPPS